MGKGESVGMSNVKIYRYDCGVAKLISILIFDKSYFADFIIL